MSCPTCGNTEPSTCRAGDLCDFSKDNKAEPNPAKEEAAPAQPAAPTSRSTISATGTGSSSVAGPALSPAKPKRSGFGKKAFLFASGAAAVVAAALALNNDEDTPSPEPRPTASAEPAAPAQPQTPMAFRFLVATGPDSVRVCNAPPSGGPSCIGFRAASGSCFQPLTDFNGNNPQGGYLEVIYSDASGRVGTGFVDLSRGVAWSETKNENNCLMTRAP